MTTLAQIARLRRDVEGTKDILLAQRNAKGIGDLEAYKERGFHAFCTEVLHDNPPWWRQVEIAEAVQSGHRVCVVSANGIGKDWSAARIALYMLFVHGYFVILTGPTQRQVFHILMSEIRRALMRSELTYELLSMELRVGGETRLLAMTSNDADKLTGYHHPKLLILATEAQGIEEEAFEAMLACTTGKDNKIYQYGNPLRATGFFCRSATSDHWHVITIPATDHPNIINGREEIPGATTQAFIESLRDEYGEASAIYQSRVLARFPTENVEGLIKLADLKRAYARWSPVPAPDAVPRTLQELSDPVRMAHRTLGVDVARYGIDRSCIAVVRGECVEHLITWRDKSVTESATEVMRWGKLYSHFVTNPQRGNPEHVALRRPTVIVDETGLGAGVVDVLKDAGWRPVGFNGAATPFTRDRFYNQRAESYWLFREALERDRLALPFDKELEEECLSVEWQLATNGTIQIIGKDMIRKAIGRSPDKLDAVVMAIWHDRRPQRRWGSSTEVWADRHVR